MPVSSTQYSKERRIAKCQRLTFVICLLVFIISTSYMRRNAIIVREKQTHRGTKSAKTKAAPNGVQIWYAPRNCRGTWRTQPARDSPGGFPYAVIRDAVVDRRPISKRILGENDSDDVVRIVLYVTTHLSAGLKADGAQVTFAQGDLFGQVEYATHVSPFIIPKVPGGYEVGLKTKYGHEVTEWQIGLRVEPNRHSQSSTDSVHKAAMGGAVANVRVWAVRFDGEEFPFHMELPLQCVMGWSPLAGMEGRRSACGDNASNANGAILLSGSALYGTKKRDRDHYREVANFAARALQGPVRFDAVAMSVVSDHSAEDMELECANDKRCREKLDEENEVLLRSIVEVVEKELQLIGVKRDLFHRVIIVPTCRLGSDANGTEENDPCLASKRYGQYHATFFSHAMVAPFFKWAVSYDMDEFISTTPQTSGHPLLGRADRILDDADEALPGPKGNLIFPWLNFKVASTNDSRVLSSNLIRGRIPELIGPEMNSTSHGCNYTATAATGKSAVRCDVGLGFTIHRPVVPIAGKRMQQRQGTRVHAGIRVWHARLGFSRGSCSYVAPTQS